MRSKDGLTVRVMSAVRIPNGNSWNSWGTLLGYSAVEHRGLDELAFVDTVLVVVGTALGLGRDGVVAGATAAEVGIP